MVCASAQCRPSRNETKKGWPESHQAANAAAADAHAPAALALRQNSPSQNAMPIIGASFQNISIPLTTSGSQKA